MGLYSHLRDLNALEDGIPYGKYVFVTAIIVIIYSIRALMQQDYIIIHFSRWFGRCFASDLSESAVKRYTIIETFFTYSTATIQYQASDLTFATVCGIEYWLVLA